MLNRSAGCSQAPHSKALLWHFLRLLEPVQSHIHRPMHPLRADSLGTRQTVLQPVSFPIWAKLPICSEAAFSPRAGSGASSLPPPPSLKASPFTPLLISGAGIYLFLYTIMHSTNTSIATRHLDKQAM